MATTDEVASLPPQLAQESVLVKSEPMPKDAETVRGFDWSNVEGGNVDYHALLQSYKRCGFQAHNFGLAVDTINEMVVFIM